MLTCAVLGLALAVVAPQGPPEQRLGNGVRVFDGAVPGSTAQAFALLVPVGFDHDPPGVAGLAEAAALALLAQAAGELPPKAFVSHSVHGTCTLFQCRVDAAHAEQGLCWCAALLRPLGPDADRLALALAQAALLADDAEEIYPGPMLQSRLRRALWSGTAAGRWQAGRAAELQAATSQQLREYVERSGGPRGAILAAVGGADPAVLRRGLELVAAVPARGQAPAPVLRASPAPGEGSTASWRTGGAFVAAGLRAPLPGDPQLLPFALGIEVLRIRAAQAFREHRAGEAKANAPFVIYDLLAGDPLAVVCRRGRNLAPASAPRSEVEELLGRFRNAPPRPQELEGGRTALQRELLAPPWPGSWPSSLAAEPSMLDPRARALALLAHAQLLDQVQAALAAADERSVAAALGPALEPAAIAWHAIVPVPPHPR